MAAAAAMFAACSETEVLNVAQESAPKAIGFETYAGKVTRANAENSGIPCSEALETHHTNFFVWGYKNTATDYVFDEVKVSYGTGWSYYQAGIQDLVYWDKAAAKYEFYAAAPATESFWTLNEKTADQADDYFTTIPFTVAPHNATDALDANPTLSFKDVANATDLMIANKEPNTTISGSVELDFMHILSRLNITVKTDLTNPVVLKSLTVGKLASTGSFNESNVDDVTLAAGTDDRWAPVSNEVTYTALVDQTISDDAQYVLEALVMPQAAAYEDIEITETTFGAPYITIVYTISGEKFTASYNLAAAFGLSSGTLAFNEGWQNTLNIKICANEISFTGLVAKWKDTDTYPEHNVGNN